MIVHGTRPTPGAGLRQRKVERHGRAHNRGAFARPPMKLALLSDLHANRQAFDACLAHARAQGATQFALLGDLVGYGADPAAVVAQAMALAEAGAWIVQGNHDAMALRPPSPARTLGEHSAQWTHDQLTPGQRAFLGALPLQAQAGSLLLVHASPEAPADWRYVRDADAAQRSLDFVKTAWPAVRHVFCGHVHAQALYYQGPGGRAMAFAPHPGVAIPVPGHRHWLATVGSAGQPRDGDPRAMYALFDAPGARLSFHRVAYDHAGAAAAIRAAGLPAFSAERLEQGQ